MTKLTSTAAALAGVAMLAASAAGPADADQSSYGVACADRAFFRERIKDSPVEVYARASGAEASRYFYTSVRAGLPAQEVDEVLFLYNPEKRDMIGAIPFVDGCALETTVMGVKVQIDQILAGMLHHGYIE